MSIKLEDLIRDQIGKGLIDKLKSLELEGIGTQITYCIVESLITVLNDYKYELAKKGAHDEANASS